MTRENYNGWLFTVVATIFGLCLVVMLLKVTYDGVTAPNQFVKKEEVVAPVGNTDEVCVKWLFQSNLDGAKKRICGR